MEKQLFKMPELAKLLYTTEGTLRQYLSRSEFTNCINGGRKNGFKNIALDENEFELLRRRINRDFR